MTTTTAPAASCQTMYPDVWACERFQQLLDGVKAYGNPLALIDWLSEQGHDEYAALLRLNLCTDRGALYTPDVKDFVEMTYRRRRDRVARAEGRFDNKNRWYPSDREDCDGSGSSVRGPSAAWPYSYLKRCHTRPHCKNLVAAKLEGRDVPSDVVATPGEWYHRRIVELSLLLPAFCASRNRASEYHRRIVELSLLLPSVP